MTIESMLIAIQLYLWVIMITLIGIYFKLN